MVKLRLPPYVQAFTDRHGRPRYYFRRAGFDRVVLPGQPYSPEFMAAHARAMAKEVQRDKVGADRAVPGTIGALVIAFLNSPAFDRLSDSTQATYRGILEGIAAAHGDKRAATLQADHIAKAMAAKAGTPAAANNLLRMLRLIMKFAVVHGWRRSDPTIGLRALKIRSSGFYAWSEADIAAFEEKHPIGSRARLALALLIYTAQRRSDVVRMGRQHVKNGVLTIRQQKTGALVEIPVLAELKAVIDATTNDHLTFLVTASGKGFSAAGFGNWFREVCDEAGLPKGCAAHGLRKAASRRLAEAGCTAHQIMAITGHRTLREVTRYTDSVDRRKMAVQAMERLKKRTASVKPSGKV
jgi:integrase